MLNIGKTHTDKHRVTVTKRDLLWKAKSSVVPWHLVSTSLGCHYLVISIGLGKIYQKKNVNIELDKRFSIDSIKSTLIIQSVDTFTVHFKKST